MDEEPRVEQDGVNATVFANPIGVGASVAGLQPSGPSYQIELTQLEADRWGWYLNEYRDGEGETIAAGFASSKETAEEAARAHIQ